MATAISNVAAPDVGVGLEPQGFETIDLVNFDSVEFRPTTAEPQSLVDISSRQIANPASELNRSDRNGNLLDTLDVVLFDEQSTQLTTNASRPVEESTLVDLGLAQPSVSDLAVSIRGLSSISNGQAPETELSNSIDSWTESYSQSQARFRLGQSAEGVPKLEVYEVMTPQIRALGNRLVQDLERLGKEAVSSDLPLDDESGTALRGTNVLFGQQALRESPASNILLTLRVEGQPVSNHSDMAASSRISLSNQPLEPIEPLTEFSRFNIFTAISSVEEASEAQKPEVLQASLVSAPVWSISAISVAGTSGWLWVRTRRKELDDRAPNDAPQGSNRRSFGRVILEEPTVQAAYRWAN